MKSRVIKTDKDYQEALRDLAQKRNDLGWLPTCVASFVNFAATRFGEAHFEIGDRLGRGRAG